MASPSFIPHLVRFLKDENTIYISAPLAFGSSYSTENISGVPITVTLFSIIFGGISGSIIKSLSSPRYYLPINPALLSITLMNVCRHILGKMEKIELPKTN